MAAQSSQIDRPPLLQLSDKNGAASQPYASWLQQAFTILFSQQQSGTTAQRPTTGLWVGRRYYDTTLGYPVYVNSVSPTVWHNSAGAVV